MLMTLQVQAHSEEVNWAPWSDVRWAGTLMRATQWLMRASLQVSVLMLVAVSWLVTLALAVLYPLCHVLGHAGPHYPLCHDSPRGPHPRVSHAMKGFKNSVAEAQPYHWAWVAVSGIAQHPYGTKGDKLQGEAGVPGCLDGRAVSLGLGDGGIVLRLGGGRHGCDRRRCL